MGEPTDKVLNGAVCTVDGTRLPEPNLGITPRVDLIRKSSYSEIVDCFDPRIRHAASHNGVSYDKERKVVNFSGTDSEGHRKFDDFELSYREVSDKVRDFTQGFIPGILTAFGMQQHLHLLT